MYIGWVQDGAAVNTSGPSGPGGPSGASGPKGNALWSPLGWPNSRTAAFQEQRAESDQCLSIRLLEAFGVGRFRSEAGNK